VQCEQIEMQKLVKSSLIWTMWWKKPDIRGNAGITLAVVSIHWITALVLSLSLALNSCAPITPSRNLLMPTASIISSSCSKDSVSHHY